LRDLEELVRRVETTEAVWKKARELAQACRSAGLTVPATDLLIAACAAHHDLDLLHKDSHFPEIARASERRRR
jgi:predicted nucleic acid-binding protein